ncbi:MAG: UDP-glucose 4-epimerase GalE [Amylibacter sp.]|nr:UDP-glucose 4-epimerase GalE [Amylibacter sp.]
MTKRVFVTGGAGYIGSHTCIELIKNNHEIMVFDSLVNSSEEALRQVELITNKKINFVIGDIRDEIELLNAMNNFQPTSVVHFAGLKAVGESVQDPLLYFDINVGGSINILRAMEKISCKEIIFSSSATVYSNKNSPPFNEADDISPISPYGRSKLMVENILTDWVTSNEANRAVVLRYFNPVGAHHSGLIGENPKGTPNNLMPLILQVAQEKRDHLWIYGEDYETRDGTGERDYIHVTDLAHGHVKALEKISQLNRLQILNLGTGLGTTVRELISTFEKTNKVTVSTKVTNRRAGDTAKSYANAVLAHELIDFQCKQTLEDMCADAWNWQKNN